MTESNKELVERLNQIMVEQYRLEMKMSELDREHNEIVYELWKRLPHLRDNPDIQPKKKVKKQ